MAIHINSKKEDVAEVVIMCGDPLRAKYISENYLDEYKMVNNVRNMLGFTGYYKGKRVSIFSHGMGIPSIGIYAYELFEFYDVKKIIRLGTAGSLKSSVDLMDVVLATSAYSLSSFPLLFAGDKEAEYKSSDLLNNSIIETAADIGIPLKVGKIITSDVFDPYSLDQENFNNCFPQDDFLASEMEAFALFYLANKMNREAACLITIVDCKHEKRALTSEERQKSLNDMITIALETL